MNAVGVLRTHALEPRGPLGVDTRVVRLLATVMALAASGMLGGCWTKPETPGNVLLTSSLLTDKSYLAAVERARARANHVPVATPEQRRKPGRVIVLRAWEISDGKRTLYWKIYDPVVLTGGAHALVSFPEHNTRWGYTISLFNTSGFTSARLELAGARIFAFSKGCWPYKEYLNSDIYWDASTDMDLIRKYYPVRDDDVGGKPFQWVDCEMFPESFPAKYLPHRPYFLDAWASLLTTGLGTLVRCVGSSRQITDADRRLIYGQLKRLAEDFAHSADTAGRKRRFRRAAKTLNKKLLAK